MKYALTLLIFITSFLAFGSGKYETNQQQAIADHVYNLKNVSSSDILVVYDIDNTLLAAKSEFGSYQWFSWQAQEIANRGENALAKNIDELIQLHSKIYAIAGMRLTEPTLPEIINNFQKNKISVMALTSRLPDSRQGTERELELAGLNLSLTSPGHSIAESFIPEGQTRMTNYQKGIFMTSGLHKGEMISFLLKKFNKTYKYIIFVDDQIRHTEEVFNQFINSTVDISTFRYGAEDLNVLAFKTSDKLEAIDLGLKFKEFIRVLN
jgi:hypothetical protein